MRKALDQQVSALLTHGSVASMTGLSARTIRRLWAVGKFPQPVEVPGLRGLRFRRAEVTTWLAELAGKAQSKGLE